MARRCGSEPTTLSRGTRRDDCEKDRSGAQVSTRCFSRVSASCMRGRERSRRYWRCRQAQRDSNDTGAGARKSPRSCQEQGICDRTHTTERGIEHPQSARNRAGIPEHSLAAQMKRFRATPAAIAYSRVRHAVTSGRRQSFAIAVEQGPRGEETATLWAPSTLTKRRSPSFFVIRISSASPRGCKVAWAT